MEGAKDFIQARIQNEESTIFVALDGEKGAGFVQLYPTFSSVGLQKAYILNDLYVDAAYRKKGVAKALMEEVFKFCEINQARYVTLETAPDNHKAKALYENMGMQVSNHYENYIKYF